MFCWSLTEIKKTITKFTHANTYFLLFFDLIPTYSDVKIHTKQTAPAESTPRDMAQYGGSLLSVVHKQNSLLGHLRS